MGLYKSRAIGRTSRLVKMRQDMRRVNAMNPDIYNPIRKKILKLSEGD